MTRQSLAAAASLLYGSHWQRPLSRALNINDRLVRRWASGEREIPSWADSAMQRLLDERRDEVTGIDAKCKTFD